MSFALAQIKPPRAAHAERPLNVAVIGAGVSGLSAAWLLSQRHRVTVFEAESSPGGHVVTVDADGVAVDMGFIVYNEAAYPNLTALFAHIGAPTRRSDMSFAVSLDDGRLEYSSAAPFAQPANLARRRFLRMLADLVRFYRDAPRDLAGDADLAVTVTLDDYLAARGYSAEFREDHLYPMAAAIWSTPAARIGDYPAAAFIRFCENHGLLKLAGRPAWRTVEGGSEAYVRLLTRGFSDRIRVGCAAQRISRTPDGVEIADVRGGGGRFDDVVIAAPADAALRLLADPTPDERRLLSAFRYGDNAAVLHSDARLMPRRRSAWASWNYLAKNGADGRSLSVTYWMNRLQGLAGARELFVTLNPHLEPHSDTVIARRAFRHALFDARAISAQGELWSLQGDRGVWYAGSYFGAGFHEDGLQAGLAVAEALGGVRRPWRVADESGRIRVYATRRLTPAFEAAS